MKIPSNNPISALLVCVCWCLVVGASAGQPATDSFLHNGATAHRGNSGDGMVFLQLWRQSQIHAIRLQGNETPPEPVWVLFAVAPRLALQPTRRFVKLHPIPEAGFTCELATGRPRDVVMQELELSPIYREIQTMAILRITAQPDSGP